MRPRQTLVLGLLLLLPVLAFLFLFRFGKNRYALPTYLPDRVDSTLVAGKWQRDTVFHQLGPFSLLASGGRRISSRELGQGLYIAQFYDGSEASQQVARALLRVQEKFRKQRQVRLATLVLAPGPGPAATLQRLAETYGTVAGKWYFLTAAPDTVATLAQREFRLGADPKRLGATPAFSTIPAGQLFLVDRERRVRGIYDGTDGREIDRLLTEIPIQLYDYDTPH